MVPWVRVQPDAPNHLKIISAGLDGFGFFVAGLCYANKYLTDGFLPAAALPAIFPACRRGQAVKLAELMVTVGLWERKDTGWQIHDFEHYQPLKIEWLDQERSQHEARVAGGRARASMATRIAGRFAGRGTSQPPAGTPADPPAEHQQPAGGRWYQQPPAEHQVRDETVRDGTEKSRSVSPSRRSRAEPADTDKEFIDALKTNPAYRGIDVDRELSKMRAWLLTAKGHGKMLTRGRIVNWLNRCDRPVNLNGSGHDEEDEE